MPKTKVNYTQTARVLSISPIEDDHTALKAIFTFSEFKGHADCEWVLHPAPTLKSALPVLRDNQVAIVISERNLEPVTWKDVLAELVSLPKPPLLIVSSQFADDYLWAEALNLGAHDVIAKPFDTEEVVRVFAFAWRRWMNHLEFPPSATNRGHGGLGLSVRNGDRACTCTAPCAGSR